VADNGEAKRLARVSSFAITERDRQGSKERSSRRHHDGTEAQQASFIKGVMGVESFAARLDGWLLM
jgi:hypothetical protein